MNDKNQKAIKSCPQTNPIMIFFILTSLVGIISKSTHHPINKKPHYWAKCPQDVTQFPALPIGVGVSSKIVSSI